MTVKEKLLEKISNIENIEFIEALSSMLNAVDEKGTFELSSSLKEELQTRSAKIDAGFYSSQKEFIEKFQKWHFP